MSTAKLSDKEFKYYKEKWNVSTVKLEVDGDGEIVMFKNFFGDKNKAMSYKNKSDINFSISDSESKLREDAIPSIARKSVIFNESNHSDPAAGTRQLISSRQNSNSENTSSTNLIESQVDNEDISYKIDDNIQTQENSADYDANGGFFYI